MHECQCRPTGGETPRRTCRHIGHETDDSFPLQPRAKLGGGCSHRGRADAAAVRIYLDAVNADTVGCLDGCNAFAAWRCAQRECARADDPHCGRAEQCGEHNHCSAEHNSDFTERDFVDCDVVNCANDFADRDRVHRKRPGRVDVKPRWIEVKHEFAKPANHDFGGAGRECGECAVGTDYLVGARSLCGTNAVVDSGGVLAVLQRRHNCRHRLLPRSVLRHKR
jgi:hypothetical protein